MPSPLPSQPSFSVVVALTPMFSTEQPMGASEVLAHSLAVRADFGFLAGDGAVGIYELISELPRILHHLGK